MLNVMVIGGATIDVIASIETEDIECMTMTNATNSFLMLEQGKKVEASRIDTQIGGGATNAAVAMSRLGATVSALLKLGNDMDADRVLQRLEAEKISTDYVKKVASEQTGKSIIISSHDKNAGVFVHRGANTTLSLEDITPEIFAGIDLVYVSTLSSTSADAFPDIVKRAKAAGAFVACNPGIRQIRNKKEQVLHALQHVDLVAINKEEATAFAEGLSCPQGSALPSLNEAPKLIKNGLGEKDAKVSLSFFGSRILNTGCPYVVVTNGSEGAYLLSSEEIVFVPSVPVAVESTIGAGDAFNSTLAFAMATNKGPEKSLKMAAINGASVASMLDTQGGLLNQDEMIKRLKQVEAQGTQRAQKFSFTPSIC